MVVVVANADVVGGVLDGAGGDVVLFVAGIMNEGTESQYKAAVKRNTIELYIVIVIMLFHDLIKRLVIN